MYRRPGQSARARPSRPTRAPEGRVLRATSSGGRHVPGSARPRPQPVPRTSPAHEASTPNSRRACEPGRRPREPSGRSGRPALVETRVKSRPAGRPRARETRRAGRSRTAMVDPGPTATMTANVSSAALARLTARSRRTWTYLGRQGHGGGRHARPVSPRPAHQGPRRTSSSRTIPRPSSRPGRPTARILVRTRLCYEAGYSRGRSAPAPRSAAQPAPGRQLDLSLGPARQRRVPCGRPVARRPPSGKAGDQRAFSTAVRAVLVSQGGSGGGRREGRRPS